MRGKRITTSIIELPQNDIKKRAEKSLLLIPNNWQAKGEEYVYPSTTDSVMKLLKQQQIPIETLNPIDASTPLQDNRALDLVVPTFVVSGLLLTSNPTLMTVALNIISNYVTELLKIIKKDPDVKLNIVQIASDGKRAQNIHYEGPVSGLPEIERILSTFEKKE